MALLASCLNFTPRHLRTRVPLLLRSWDSSAVQGENKGEKDADMRATVDTGEFRNARLTILGLEVKAGGYGLPPPLPPPLHLIDYILQAALQLPMYQWA